MAKRFEELRTRLSILIGLYEVSKPLDPLLRPRG